MTKREFISCDGIDCTARRPVHVNENSAEADLAWCQVTVAEMVPSVQRYPRGSRTLDLCGSCRMAPPPFGFPDKVGEV